MASSASKATIKMLLEVIEDLGLSTVTDDQVTHKYEKSGIYTSTSTPDVALVYEGTVALTAGTATLDLTNVSDKGGNTIATTDLKVRMIYARPTTTNTGALTLTEGSSNGYELFGSGWTIALTAGQEFVAFCDSDTPDVTASTCEIDLSGTGTESIDLLIVFG